MQIVKPTSVTVAAPVTGNLLSTNVVNPYPEWSSAGVSYTLGSYVVVGNYTGSNTVDITSSGTYRCLIDHVSNASNGPLQSASNWVRIGPTNQFAVFDNSVSSSTTSTSNIVFTVRSSLIDSVAVLNVFGSKVKVEVVDADTSSTVYSRTIQLSGAESIDWYSYFFFFEEEAQKTQALFLDIPKVSNSRTTITIYGSGNVSVGSFVMGQIKEIGQVQYGVNTGIIDYSRKETDEFGNTSLVVRNYSKRMNAKVFLSNTNLNKVQRLLYSIRATPVLWIGSEDILLEEPLVVFGYYKDFDTEIAYPAHSLCNLQIEGLI